jgi:hypothetical protein
VLRKQKSVLPALTDTHHGFYVGAARYACEQGHLAISEENVGPVRNLD